MVLRVEDSASGSETYGWRDEASDKRASDLEVEKLAECGSKK